MHRALIYLLKLRLRAGSAVSRARQQFRNLIWIAFFSPVLLCVVVILWQYWSQLDGYLLEYGQDVTRQLAIAIGTAITGLVAIVFSLTLFTVQRAADKGTPRIFKEFSRDLWLWLVYWALALIAVACFLAGLLPVRHTAITFVAVCEFALILATFILLRFHFHRAIQLVSARGMIDRYHKRGLKQIRRVKRLENTLIAAGLIRPGGGGPRQNG